MARRPSASAEQVFEARGRLLEEALVFARLAEDDVQHDPVPRVRHRGHTRAPTLHERPQRPRVVFEDGPKRSRTIPLRAFRLRRGNDIVLDACGRATPNSASAVCSH